MIKKFTLNGIIRCLRILKSKCGTTMCFFMLDGEETSEVIVFPPCYSEHEQFIKNGARVRVEAEQSRDRLLALSVIREEGR